DRLLAVLLRLRLAVDVTAGLDVEEVDLPVDRDDVSVLVENDAGVRKLLAAVAALGDRAADDRDPVRARPRGHRLDRLAALERLRALGAFRSRDFRLLWSGQTVSLVGDGAFLIALGWRTTQLTGKSSSLAIVLMAHGLALLTTLLIGGALADRYSRRTLMILSD